MELHHEIKLDISLDGMIILTEDKLYFQSRIQKDIH